MVNKPCLLAMVTYDRIEMTQNSLSSLLSTADPSLYTIMLVDNGSQDGTVDWLRSLTSDSIEDILYNSSNLGTAAAINKVWKIAYERGQHAGKIDNDVIWYDPDWLSKMLYVLDNAENVGLVGLKRRDLEEKPNHRPDSFYRTWFYTMPNGQVIEISNHVMGTCWLVSKIALERVGALVQIGPYGLDDSIFCSRMNIAGFLNAFLPDVAIEHIDPGDSMYPEYTQWKIRQAGEVLNSGAYDKIMKEYQSGIRPVLKSF